MSPAVEVPLVAVVLIPLLFLWAAALFHIFRRRPDLSLQWKGIWSAVVLVFPYVGVLLYAMLRPPAEIERGQAGHHDPTPLAGALARLQTLVEDHDRGRIGDDAYLAAKREVFGLDAQTG